MELTEMRKGRKRIQTKGGIQRLSLALAIVLMAALIASVAANV